MTERIISAAVHYGGMIFSLPAPARHHTILQRYHECFQEVMSGKQGFLTSAGRYVGRREALHIALEAKQLMKQEQGLSELYSEDLW